MTHDWANVVLSALGAVVGGSATTWWFLYRRGLEPSSELGLEIFFAGRQADNFIVEVVATLQNKSSVRQAYRDLQLSIRYLLPEDIIEEGSEKIGYQLKMNRSIDTRIGSKRYFAHAEYIDAGINFRHSYITFVPANATVLWLNSRLQFRTREHWYSHSFVWHTKSSQRLVSVPLAEKSEALLKIQRGAEAKRPRSSAAPAARLRTPPPNKESHSQKA
ncbi:hypothetical protein BH11PSE9_BH11PSE9_18290 [soil metagenome]